MIGLVVVVGFVVVVQFVFLKGVLIGSDVVEVLFVDVVGEDVVGLEGPVGIGVGATIVVGEATRTSTKMTPKTAKKAKPRRSRKPIWILRSIKSFLYSLIALA